MRAAAPRPSRPGPAGTRGDQAELARSVAIAALPVIAATHFADLPDKVEEAPYMAALFVADILSSLALAGLLIARRWERHAIRAGGALAFMTLTGYVMSRSVGLPQLEDHVGRWLDPGGLAAAAAEITLIGVAISPALAAPTRLAAFVAVPVSVLVAAGVVAGQPFAGHAAAGEHPGGAAAHVGRALQVGSHAHGAGRPEYPDVASATEGERAGAERLFDEARVASRDRFARYEALRGMGYVRFSGRAWRRPLAFHVRNRAYEHDGRVLDAQRPEALVFWWPRRGRPILIAMMFRAARDEAAPRALSLLSWHRHGNPRSGRAGKTLMTHVWLTNDLRTGLANCLPVDALEAAHPSFRYAAPGYVQAQETLPCATEPRGG